MGGADEDFGNSIQQTSDGGFITIGYTNSTSKDITGNNGLNDFWIVKLEEEEALSINKVEKDIIQIYPNPVTSVLNIKTVNEVTFDKIIITDLLGNLVLEQKLKNLKVNINKLSLGVYILQLKSENNSHKMKFIKH